MIRNPRLYPHIEGHPNLSAFGEYALLYKHPHDLHMTPIFDQVSMEWLQNYVRTRTWCQDAIEQGWKFVCLRSNELLSRGVVQ